MAYQFISMIDPPPGGFIFSPELRLRDLRRGVFACVASSVEKAEHTLAPMVGKIWGLIVTLGADTAIWELRAPGIYHLAVPPALRDHLAWVVPPMLFLIERESNEKEGRRICELDLERMADDVRRLAEQSSDASRLLSAELAERRIAQKDLEVSQKWFRTIFDSVNDAVLVHDAQTGQILDVNQRMCDLYEMSYPEALESQVEDFSTGGVAYSMDRALDYIRKAAAGNPQIFEWMCRSRSGRVFWVEVSMKAATLADRHCVLALVRDISERKKAESQHRQLESKMQQSQKLESLGIMAGGIAHDFNNLLMTILGNADLALGELPPEESARENIQEIVTASKRAADLCAQMLAYAGKGKVMTRSLDLNALISGMRHMFESSVSKKVVFSVKYADNLPTVQGDDAQIQQVVMNLVLNAAEALGNKEGEVTLVTGVQHCDDSFWRGARSGAERPAGDFVYVEVSDNGVGIKPANMDKIFDPFYSTKFAGRGLGLAAVLGIVNGHKGHITVASEPGKGTRFKVLLPAAHDVGDTSSVVSEGGANASGSLLLVDDDESILKVTSRILAGIGYNVMVAQSGEKAVEIVKAKKTPIRCVILDLNMPHMNGEETYRELRKVDATLPVLISSGYGEDDVLNRFSGERCVDIMQKPYRSSALRAKLKAFLGAK